MGYVDQPGRALGVDEHVAGVQVGMAQAEREGVGQRLAQIARDQALVHRPGGLAGAELGQRMRAGDQLDRELEAARRAREPQGARNAQASLGQTPEHALLPPRPQAVEEPSREALRSKALDHATELVLARSRGLQLDAAMQPAFEDRSAAVHRGAASYRKPSQGPGRSLLCARPYDWARPPPRIAALKLELYVLRQLLVALGFAIGVMLFIALPGIAAAAVHKLENADILLVFHYLPIVLQSLTPYVIPIGFLLAVVATFGRLAAENEWTAIHMAGIRPVTRRWPAAALALALGVGMYWMMCYELPTLKRREKEFLVSALRSSLLHLPPGKNSIEFGGFTLNGFRDGEYFTQAYIRKPGKEGEAPMRVYARKALLRLENNALLIDMTDVETVGPDISAKIATEHVEWRFDLSEFVRSDERTYTSPRYRTSPELLQALRSEVSDSRTRSEFQYELHARYAMSASCLLFLLLGAPTGLILRRGSRLGALAIAVVYALAYYLLSMRLGKQLALKQVVPAPLAAWLTTGLGLAWGASFLRKALRR